MIALLVGLATTGPVLKTDVASAEPVPLTNAASWFSPDDYPVSALRSNEEGAVRFALDVAATGAVTGCRIIESSGHADLDAQTCSSALLHARFKPAVDSAGKPMASTFVRRTVWRIPQDKRAPGDEFGPLGWLGAGMNMQTAMADVAVDATGRVTGCTIKRAYGTKADPCRQFPIGIALVDPVIVDGKAVAGTVHAVTIISVAGQDEKPNVDAP
jgi:TonB family protein